MVSDGNKRNYIYGWNLIKGGQSLSALGDMTIGRDEGQKDYYKIIDWRGKIYYLVCNGSDKYEWIRCYDWGKVVDSFMSCSKPMEFIQDQVHAFNIETRTGVKLIKQLKRLPFSYDN